MAAFDPDAYLAQAKPKLPVPVVGGFDPDAYLRAAQGAKPIQPFLTPPQQASYPDSGLRDLQAQAAADEAERKRMEAAPRLATVSERILQAAGASESPETYQSILEKRDNDTRKFIAENTAPDGVPLDINDSADFGTRFAFSHKTPQEQFDALAAEGLKPRVSSDGQRIIIRTPNGKKDVLYSPQGLDVAGNIAPIAEGAGKMAASVIVGTPGAGVGTFLAPGTLAGLSSGVVRGLAAASIPAMTLAAGGSLKDAAIDTALNAGPPAAVMAGGALASRGLNYLRSAATVEEQAALDAARAAAPRLGISPPIPPRLNTAMNTPLAGSLGRDAIRRQAAELEGALSRRGLGANAGVPLESDVSRSARGPLLDIGENATRVADTINADTRAANAARQAEADAINAARLAEDKASREAAQEAIRKGVADTLGPRAVTADTEMGVGSRLVGGVRAIDQSAKDALDAAKDKIFQAAPDATVSLDNLNNLRVNLRAQVSPLGADVEPLLAQIDSKIKTLVQGGKSTMTKSGAEAEQGLTGLGAEPNMADLSDKIRAIDRKLAGKVYGKEKIDLLKQRLQLGADMGHKPSEDALMKLEQSAGTPDANSVIRDVVEKYGINSNHPVMGGEIRNLAENGVPKRLITPKGANPDSLGEGINEALVANGLPPIQGIDESSALQAVNDAYQSVPDKFPPTVNLPLVGPDKASGPLLSSPATKGMVEVPPTDPIRLSPAQADELRQYIDSGIPWKDFGDKGSALKVQFRNALRDDTASALEGHTQGLGKKYTDALTEYSDVETRLSDARIKPARLGDETGRSLVPEDIIDGLVSGRGSPSSFTAWARGLGFDNPIMDDLKRQALSRVVAMADGDVTKLAKSFGDMHFEQRAILLGDKADATLESLRAQSVLAKASAGEDVPTAQLASAMKAAPPDVAAATQKAIDASNIAKQKFAAVLKEETAKPVIDPHFADLVNGNEEHLVSALDSAGSAEKTRRVLGVLDAQTKDDFYRRALQNILDKAAETTPKTELPTGRLDPNKLRAAIGSGDNAANVREMVGGDTPIQFLRDLADTLTQQNSNAVVSDAAKLTGGSVYHGIKEGGVTGLGGGLLTGNAAKGSGIGAGIGLLAKTVPRVGQSLLGNAMRNDAVRNFLINGALPDFSGAARASSLVRPVKNLIQGANSSLEKDRAETLPTSSPLGSSLARPTRR